MELVYDGSFEGLLCALECGCDDKRVERLTAQQAAEPTLFGERGEIPTVTARAAGFAQRLRSASSREVLHNVLYNYLSEVAGFETALLQYVRLAFTHGAEVDRYHAHDAVRAVHMLTRKVGCELHRFTGLARFRELRDGTWWAPIAPDHNIACGLALHFRRRMPGHAWVIYDVQRDYGVRWDTREFTLVSMNEELRRDGLGDLGMWEPWYSEAERKFQRLWRGYFESIAIAARRNPSLQRRFMPQRYWRYLIERPGSSRRVGEVSTGQGTRPA